MQVIEKAIEIVELMAKDSSRNFWRLTDISKSLNMNISTAHRLVQSLKKSGVIFQDDESKKYSLGLNLIYYGEMVKEMNLPGIIVRPILEKLYNEIGETVFVTIPDRNECVVIDRINSHHQLRIVKSIGETKKLHEGSCGKVILPYLPERVLEDFISQVSKLGEIDEGEFRAMIESIKENGYLVEDIPSLYATSFSAPLFTYNGNYIASLSTAIPNSRLTPQRSCEIVNTLKKIAKEYKCLHYKND